MLFVRITRRFRELPNRGKNSIYLFDVFNLLPLQVKQVCECKRNLTKTQIYYSQSNGEASICLFFFLLNIEMEKKYILPTPAFSNGFFLKTSFISMLEWYELSKYSLHSPGKFYKKHCAFAIVFELSFICLCFFSNREVCKRAASQRNYTNATQTFPESKSPQHKTSKKTNTA